MAVFLSERVNHSSDFGPAKICDLLHPGIDESRSYGVKSMLRRDSRLAQRIYGRKHDDLCVGSMVQVPMTNEEWVNAARCREKYAWKAQELSQQRLHDCASCKSHPRPSKEV